MARPTATADSKNLTDRTIVELLRRHGNCSISDLVNHVGVTATAIRQRINRLMNQGLVKSESKVAGRGRPKNQYSLTEQGVHIGGDNYQDLATVLWTEIRAVEDQDVRQGLLGRIVGRLADVYRDRISGSDLTEKMTKLVDLMSERDIPFEVQKDTNSQLPVLTAMACPYPDLAEQDRSICSMEMMLFSEIFGEKVRLTSCRLDGDNCCNFEASANSPSAT